MASKNLDKSNAVQQSNEKQDRKVRDLRWPKPAVLQFIESYRVLIPAISSGLTPRSLWIQMADSMKDHGYEYTAFQLNEKFKSLKRTYESLKAKSKIYEVGSKSMWEYYELLDEVFKTNPRKKPIFSYNGETVTLTQRNNALTSASRLSEKQDCSIWPSNAVLLFLELYGSLHSKFMTSPISQLEQIKLWKEIAAKMKAKGYEYTSKECASKLFNLKKQYTVCKRHNATPGNRKRPWQYYDLMNGIFDKNSKTGISSVESTPHPSCKGSTFQTVKWASNVSSTQATGLNKGTLRSKLQNLIKQKERREADRRERHRRRMESDEKLYSILETLVNEI